MTLESLIQLYRARTLDNADPPLCDDEILTLYANEAQVEACRRALLLRQSSGPMCTLAFKAGDELITLDARVVRVLRSFVNGEAVNVVPVEYMDENHPNWQFSGAAQDGPKVLVSGLTTDALHLWPVPSKAGEVRLSVQRLPLKDMRVPSEKPEIRPEAHAALLDWILYRVYSTQDVDLIDNQQAQAALRRFEAEFGSKASIRNETWVRDGVGMLPEPLA